MSTILSKLFLMSLCIVAFGFAKNNNPKVSIEKEVNDWLTEKQNKLKSTDLISIKKLKENLDIENHWTTPYETEKSIIIIPITKAYELINNKGNNPQNYLVLFKNKESKITGGYIWQYVGDSELFTKNSIPNIYNHVDKDLSGTFRTLDINDVFLSEMVFENDKNTIIKLRQPELKGNGSSPTIECYDWYYVVEDLKTRTQTKTFLYTNCENNCIYKAPENKTAKFCSN